MYLLSQSLANWCEKQFSVHRHLCGRREKRRDYVIDIYGLRKTNIDDVKNIDLFVSFRSDKLAERIVSMWENCYYYYFFFSFVRTFIGCCRLHQSVNGIE